MPKCEKIKVPSMNDTSKNSAAQTTLSIPSDHSCELWCLLQSNGVIMVNIPLTLRGFWSFFLFKSCWYDKYHLVYYQFDDNQLHSMCFHWIINKISLNSSLYSGRYNIFKPLKPLSRVGVFSRVVRCLPWPLPLLPLPSNPEGLPYPCQSLWGISERSGALESEWYPRVWQQHLRSLY